MNINQIFDQVKQNKILTIIILIYVASIFTTLTPWIHGGDGVGYYVYTRSMFIDGDLDFKNEYEYYKDFWTLRDTIDNETGKGFSQYPIGVPLLWSPFFLTGHGYSEITGQSTDGYSSTYAWWICFGSSIYGILGIILIYNTLKKKFDKTIAGLSALGIFLATNLYYYMFFEGSLSHAIAFFLVTTMICYWLKIRSNYTHKNLFIIGLLIGLIYITRLQDVLYGLIPAFDVFLTFIQKIMKKHFKKVKKIILGGILTITGFVLVNIPQQLNLLYHHGELFSSSKHYIQHFLPFTISGLIQVLIGPNRGIISWHPILLFGLLGYFIYFKENKQESISLLLGLTAQLILITKFYDSPGAQGFGARYFTSSLVIFGIGIAYSIKFLSEKLQDFEWRNKKIQVSKIISVFIVIFLIVWNFGLMMQYGTRMIPSEDATPFIEIAKNNLFVIPFKAIDIIKEYLQLKPKLADKEITHLNSESPN